MTTPRRTWTDEDLELFHDGELPEPLRGEVSADLLVDDGLRARLADIEALDKLVGRELTRPGGNAVIGSLLTLRLMVRLGAAAAVLTLGTWLLWTGTHVGSTSRKGGGPVQTAANVDGGVTTASAPSARPAVVLAEIRLPASTNYEVERHASPVQIEPASTAVPVADLLARGDVDGVAAALARLPDAERPNGYAALGSALQSAMTAERVLDRLSPAEQVEVCAAWAADARLRVVAFERLALLQERAELRLRLSQVAGELARSRDLAPWVRSYRLVHSGPLAG